MNGRQVIYKDGNNDKFDYFLLAEKKEISINQNSLAYKVDPSVDKTFIIEHNTATGNFDLMLVQVTKQGDFRGYILCDYPDISII
ncbi:MAG: hypothetical protein JSR97_12275 [Verrucomicrobia bacterium]|nr:hypothetical protein [Verrucomicrobiota bacterium]